MQLLSQQVTPNKHSNANTVDPDKERSVLGKGAFGIVYKMIHPHDQHVYAVNELANLTLEDGSADEAAMFGMLAEVRMMGVVESQFIVKYHTSAVYGGHFYVMMEHIASIRTGSLSQLSRRCRGDDA